MRKNIFEILSKDFDVNREITLIWHLFTKAMIFVPYDSRTSYGRRHFNEISIIECVDSFSFVDWKARNRCISSLDMMERLGIDEDTINSLTVFSNETFVILEFIVNMIKRCDIAKKRNGFNSSDDFEMLNQNIKTFLEHFGYTTDYFEDDETVIIVEKNPAAISAAEISEPGTSKKIIQYNHYMLKGNIDAKRDILLALAKEVEPKRDELKQITPVFADDLFFMFNNMNLRHNNKEPNSKHYKPYVVNMDINKLESWYDEIYQMILLAKLLLDNKRRHADIDTLKVNF